MPPGDDASTLRLSMTMKRDGDTIGEGATNQGQSALPDESKILPNDVVGPLVLEALDGFLLALTRNGEISFVSENTKNYLKFAPGDLRARSLFSILHAEDRTDVEQCLGDLRTNFQLTGGNAPLASRTRVCNCRMLVRIDNVNGGADLTGGHGQGVYEPMQLMLIQQLHGDDSRNQLNGMTTANSDEYFIACIVRRTNMMDKLPVADGLSQFVTKQDMNGKILDCNTSDANVSSALIGCSIQDFCHTNDVNQMNKHYREVVRNGSNLSGVYRFRMPQGHYVFVQTKSKLFTNPNSGHPEFIMSTHSVVRQCDDESELNGSASNCLMKSLINGSLTGPAVNEVDGRLRQSSSSSLADFSSNVHHTQNNILSQLLDTSTGPGPGPGPPSSTDNFDLDSVMEYLQSQNASMTDVDVLMTSMNAGINADLLPNRTVIGNKPASVHPNGSMNSSGAAMPVLSIAALQQLASECSTFDLSSLEDSAGGMSTTLDHQQPVSGHAPGFSDIRLIDNEMKALLAELLSPVQNTVQQPGVPQQQVPHPLSLAVTGSSTPSTSQSLLLRRQLMRSSPSTSAGAETSNVSPLQSLQASVVSLQSLHFPLPGTSVTGSSAVGPLSAGASLIEHIRRAKRSTPTASPMLAAVALQSPRVTGAQEVFQTPQSVGLKDLLMRNDELESGPKQDLFGDDIASKRPDAQARSADGPGRPGRQAVILKKLLEEKPEDDSALSGSASVTDAACGTGSTSWHSDSQANASDSHTQLQLLMRSLSSGDRPLNSTSSGTNFQMSGSPASANCVARSPLVLMSMSNSEAMTPATPRQRSVAPSPVGIDDQAPLTPMPTHASPAVSFTSSNNFPMWTVMATGSLPASSSSLFAGSSISTSAGPSGRDSLLLTYSQSKSSVTGTAASPVSGQSVVPASPRTTLAKNTLLRQLLNHSASPSDPPLMKLLPRLRTSVDGDSHSSLSLPHTITSITSVVAESHPVSRAEPVAGQSPGHLIKTGAPVTDDRLKQHLTKLWERDDSIPMNHSGSNGGAGTKRKASTLASPADLASIGSPPSVSSTGSSGSGGRTPGGRTTSTGMLTNPSVGSTPPVFSPDLPFVDSSASGAHQVNQPRSASTSLQPVMSKRARKSEPNLRVANRHPSSVSVHSNASDVLLSSTLGNSCSSPALSQLLTSPTEDGLASSLPPSVGLPASAGVPPLFDASENSAVASQMLVDDAELYKQLEMILGDTTMSFSELDNVFTGGTVGSTSSSTSETDRRAIDAIQSQLMFETSNSGMVRQTVNNPPPQQSRPGSELSLLQLLNAGNEVLHAESTLVSAAAKSESSVKVPARRPSLASVNHNLAGPNLIALYPDLMTPALPQSPASTGSHCDVVALVQRAAAEAAAQSARPLTSSGAEVTRPTTSQPVTKATSPNLNELMNVSFAPNVSLQPNVGVTLRVQTPAVRPAPRSSAAAVPQFAARQLVQCTPVRQVMQPVPATLLQPVSVNGAGARLVWNQNTGSAMMAGGVIMQGDIFGQLNGLAVSGLTVGTPTIVQNHQLCVIGSDGTSRGSTLVPVALVPQPATLVPVVSGTSMNHDFSGADNIQRISLGGDAAVFVSQPSLQLLNNRPGLQTRMPLQPQTPLIIHTPKAEKSDDAGITPQQPLFNFGNVTWTNSSSIADTPSTSNDRPSYAATSAMEVSGELPLDVLESLNELTQEHSAEQSAMEGKHSPVIIIPASNLCAIPPPSILQNMELIQNWLQQSEQQAGTVPQQLMSLEAAAAPSLPHRAPAPPPPHTTTSEPQRPHIARLVQAQPAGFGPQSQQPRPRQPAAMGRPYDNHMDPKSVILQRNFVGAAMSLGMQSSPGGVQLGRNVRSSAECTVLPRATTPAVTSFIGVTTSGTVRAKELCRQQLLAKNLASQSTIASRGLPSSRMHGVLINGNSSTVSSSTQQNASTSAVLQSNTFVSLSSGGSHSMNSRADNVTQYAINHAVNQHSDRRAPESRSPASSHGSVQVSDSGNSGARKCSPAAEVKQPTASILQQLLSD